MLKVGRPRTYHQSQTISNPLTHLLGGPIGLPLNPLNPTNPLGSLLSSGQNMNAVPTTNILKNTTKIQPPSRILVLKNMVQLHELEIDEEYNEILEDVKEECQKYGQVLSVKIPRPEGGNDKIPGLGRIFVEYSAVDEAKEARKQLQGRIFSNNTVEASYHDEAKYAANDFTETQ